MVKKYKIGRDHFEINDEVYVHLYDQFGKIVKIHQDDIGGDIFTVLLNDDKIKVLCRIFEISE